MCLKDLSLTKVTSIKVCLWKKSSASIVTYISSQKISLKQFARTRRAPKNAKNGRKKENVKRKRFGRNARRRARNVQEYLIAV